MSTINPRFQLRLATFNGKLWALQSTMRSVTWQAIVNCMMEYASGCDGQSLTQITDPRRRILEESGSNYIFHLENYGDSFSSEIETRISQFNKDHKSPRTEIQLVNILFNTPVVGMELKYQVYWYFNILDISLSMNNDVYFLRKVQERLKKSNIPEKYTKLLDVPKFEFLYDIFDSNVLCIISSYCIIDRDSFVSSLIKL